MLRAVCDVHRAQEADGRASEATDAKSELRNGGGASHRSPASQPAPVRVLRRKALSPSNCHAPPPRSRTPQHSTTTAPRGLSPRTSSALLHHHYHHHHHHHPHPNGPLSLTIPRDASTTPTLLTNSTDNEAQPLPSLPPANHQPGGHSSTAKRLPFARPHKAPPGAETQLRCCYQREA